MVFWIPALIPLLGVLGILVSPLWPVTKGDRWDKRDNWKKFGIYFAVNTIACVGLALGLWYLATSKTKYPEVWNYKIHSIRHEEKWTEKESRTRMVACGTDSKGRTIYRTETYYVTQSYGPYWKAFDEL